jgi:hypothetical protein
LPSRFTRIEPCKHCFGLDSTPGSCILRGNQTNTSMASPIDTLYKTATGHAWVGETWIGRNPTAAAFSARLPVADDPRWAPGKPSMLDTEFPTLSPFFPSDRLGVSVEKKPSQPMFQNVNHPPFQGCVAWMPMESIEWQPTADSVEVAVR